MPKRSHRARMSTIELYIEVLLNCETIVVIGAKNCYAEVRVTIIIDYSDYINAIFEHCFR